MKVGLVREEWSNLMGEVFGLATEEAEQKCFNPWLPHCMHLCPLNRYCAGKNTELKMQSRPNPWAWQARAMALITEALAHIEAAQLQMPAYLPVSKGDTGL